MNQVITVQKRIKQKKSKKSSNKSTNIIDQDYLMYNSSEDEKQLRDYVHENYHNSVFYNSEER